MEDPFGMADLGQYMMNSRSRTRPSSWQILPPPPQDLISGQMLAFRPEDDSTTVVSLTSPYNGFVGGAESSSAATRVADSGGGRWPRQETLTLLEIRSRLDPKFKEANQKGILWDEISRIMSEEHGYQRSGKKCREKFENLFKYYKKTKEGKAGRQDGKNYRFFRQLDAFYNEPSNSISTSKTQFNGGGFHGTFQKLTTSSSPDNLNLMPKLSDTSFTLSNSSEGNTSSSSQHNPERLMNDSRKKKKIIGKKRWKVEISDFIDLQMKKLVDKQEAEMEKMMTTMEEKEKKRMEREEEWRKQDSARIEREQKLWASERAWIEARDEALMDTLHKMTKRDDIQSLNGNWQDFEVNRLIQLRSEMELKFHKNSGIPEEFLWEEIATKMACFGYFKSGLMCREKWENMKNYRKLNKMETLCNQGIGSYYEQNHNQVKSIEMMNNTGLRYFMGNDYYGRIIMD